MRSYILNTKTLSQSMNKYKGAPIYVQKQTCNCKENQRCEERPQNCTAQWL